MTTRRTDESVPQRDRFAGWQGRQQVTVTLILCAVITVATATYTWITWKSVAATREASEIQRQLLDLQKAHPTFKAASARRQNARAVTQATHESQREKARSRSGARDQNAARQESIDREAAPAAESNGARQPGTWTTRSAMAERFGRQ
jgi:uncharacterized protein HemX